MYLVTLQHCERRLCALSAQRSPCLYSMHWRRDTLFQGCYVSVHFANVIFIPWLFDWMTGLNDFWLTDQWTHRHAEESANERTHTHTHTCLTLERLNSYNNRFWDFEVKYLRPGMSQKVAILWLFLNILDKCSHFFSTPETFCKYEIMYTYT